MTVILLLTLTLLKWLVFATSIEPGKPACLHVDWPSSILLADQHQVLIFILLKMIMDSAKKGFLTSSFKKFSRLKVKLNFLLTQLRCSHVPEIMQGWEPWGLPPPEKLEGRHITFTVLVWHKLNKKRIFVLLLRYSSGIRKNKNSVIKLNLVFTSLKVWIKWNCIDNVFAVCVYRALKGVKLVYQGIKYWR